MAAAAPPTTPMLKRQDKRGVRLALPALTAEVACTYAMMAKIHAEPPNRLVQ